MKKLLFASFVLIVTPFIVLLVAYQAAELKYFRTLSAQYESNVIQSIIGKPHDVTIVPDALRSVGWDLPKKIPSRTAEIWIYDCISGRRFYLFFDTSGKLISFFSSSS